MDLNFDKNVAINYKSNSQKIRVMSEFWFLTNVFCPCCGNSHVEKMQNNFPVADIFCKRCGEIFELKSKKNSTGAKILDGAYHTMIERITSNTNPQLLVMNYSENLSVTNLIFIPKFFFTPAIIERRKPLSQNARRAGWIGCNILYKKIPEQGKIHIIREGEELKSDEVTSQYLRIKKLQIDNVRLRGWMLDVLNCINDIKSEIFTLNEIYKYAEFLKDRHFYNHNVEAKIRQQLQFLRDRGFIEFIGRGIYKKI